MHDLTELIELRKKYRSIITKNANLSRNIKNMQERIERLKSENETLRKDKYEQEFENSTIGQRIRKIREMRDMTVEQTIYFLNKNQTFKQIKKNHFDEWENDIGRPKLEHIVILCRIWDCSTRYLEFGIIESCNDRWYRSKSAREDEINVW